jgi:hypothetical protein
VRLENPVPPNITGGVGGLSDAEKLLEAQTLRRARLLAADNDRMERKQQQRNLGGAGGETVQEMLERTSVQGPLTLGQQQEWSTSFASATAQGGRAQPGQIQRERYDDSRLAVASAAASEKAEAEQKATEQLALFSRGLTVAAAAAAIAAATFNSMRDMQKSAVMSLDESRIARGGALSMMGMSEVAQAEWSKRSESKEGPGGGLTAADEALLLQTWTSQVRIPGLAKKMLPMFQKVMYDKNLPRSEKFRLANEGVGIAAAGVFTQGRSGASEEYGEAIDKVVFGEGKKTATARDVYDVGSETQILDDRIVAMQTGGGLKGLMYTALNNPLTRGVARSFAEDEIRYGENEQGRWVRDQRPLSVIVRNLPREAPPSTNAGRSGPLP